ncbi:MAG TPA: ABC transporter substrate-binding protein [Dehalococcoidia bacterium]|jgi:alpha-glucoside transport system substrate-binding protein|nr:ABC transporter substrate-binding protein [Dehalococcoidia bacterium]
MLKDWAIRLALVSCIVGAAAFAACGDDDDDGDNGGGDGNTPAAGQTGTGGGDQGEVNVLGIWGDEELASFEAMVAGWGGKMNFTGTRDITAILTTRVEGGNAPDVAVPAEVGLFQQFAREGKLTPLSACPGLEDTVRNNYPQSFIDLATVDGTLYGFFMKADTKATIFYNPKFFSDNSLEPLDDSATFDDLIALSDQIKNAGTPPWSMGQEAGGGSGFPGSDTIQQIFINEAGVEAYDQVVSGDIPYTDDRVKDAWEKFGQIALTDGYTVQGGGAGINATPFMDSSYPPFETPPTAAMVALGGFAAGFITDQFPNAEPGTDFDFFGWPGGAVTGGANIAYAFNSNPSTCSFMNHIASAEAQDVWVKRGGFTSVNKQVSIDSYPNEVARKQAQQLLDADTFRFDMDDAIGGAGQQAIFAGVIQYLTNPNSLDGILQSVQTAIGGQ